MAKKESKEVAALKTRILVLEGQIHFNTSKALEEKDIRRGDELYKDVCHNGEVFRITQRGDRFRNLSIMAQYFILGAADRTATGDLKGISDLLQKTIRMIDDEYSQLIIRDAQAEETRGNAKS